MKTFIQILFIAFGFISTVHAQTYTLNWGSSFAGGWPNTATTRNAVNIGGSAVNCNVNITKSGGVYTTVLGPYGGPATPTVTSSTFVVAGSSSNMQLSLDFTTNTQYCDIVFTFNQPVFNVRFNLADIDRLYNTLDNYYDKITVTGYIGMLSGGATITKYDAATDPNFMFISGNTAYVNSAYGMSGNTASDATDQKGTIICKFEGFYITSFRIRYTNSAGALADPTVQNIAIGNISFQKSVPLPVTLTSFDGLADQNGASKLFWNTTEETEFDYYSIEKSMDGKEFEEIGTIQGKGAATSYTYTDYSRNETKKYYRLKMVNLDGSFAYSKTIILGTPRNSGFSAFPTIISDHITVAYTSKKEETRLLEIINLNGQVVYRKQLKTVIGSNRTVIDLPGNLASGQYRIKLQHQPGQVTMIKQ